MLTGELPLGRFPAPSEKAGTDPRLDTVVFRTLEKQRERRYQTAGEMKTQVENVAAAPPLPAPAPPRRTIERTSRKAVWGFVMVLLGLLLGFGGLVSTSVHERVQSQRFYEEQNRIQAERLRLKNLVEQAGRGSMTREQFDAARRSLRLPESWFPTHPPRAVPDSPGEFKERMLEWLRAIESNPQTLPPPPPAERSPEQLNR
jgi:hypothetical protein